MLLIYSAEISLRLQYICKFIFDEVLGVSHNITLHDVRFNAHEGPKINYSDLSFSESYTIRPHKLLFEKEIKLQELKCTEEDGRKTFFNAPGSDHRFDIFAAVFYLISRYEEYLPHRKDMYGRYAHENSLAYKEGFLHTPLVNIWLLNLKEKLEKYFPSLKFAGKQFKYIPTYDIDIAWSYKEKGLLRNMAGFFRKPTWERIGTLAGNKTDPYDCYRFLHDLHDRIDPDPIYFFLVAERNGKYDKNILPANQHMQSLIKEHAEKYEIGLHPSWKSNDEEVILKQEKNILENISGKEIRSSRQHYIKFNLPETYQHLIKAGITEDYSMGYGSINGFRASVASSFLWYDLSQEKITSLRIHPFCFMDANCYYEEKLSVEDSYTELVHFYNECKKVNGLFITIFHNSFLGNAEEFTGWKELCIKFISQIH